MAKIAILGPGAIGGLLAAVFSRAGEEVICIAKIGQESKNGIRLTSAVFGNFTVRPRTVNRLDTQPDVLFVTVKAPHLSEAMESVPREYIENSVVISLLNGLGHAEILRDRFGPRVAVGMIGALEVKSEEPGSVEHLTSQRPHIELASDKDIARERLEKIAEMLKSAGLSVSILDREAEVIWRKVVRLNAIAATTAAAQKPVGYIRSDPEWRRTLESCVSEGVEVARAEGVAMDPEEVMRQIDALPKDLTTSLARDIAAGRPFELDAILGGVLERAERHNIICPAIKELYEKLKKI